MLLKQQNNIKNFDDLYSLVNSINFENLIKKNFPIIVKATSIRSKLHHTPSLQSITKKAIIKKIA
jgi:putative N6-adenine-specific DNA methylase